MPAIQTTAVGGCGPGISAGPTRVKGVAAARKIGSGAEPTSGTGYAYGAHTIVAVGRFVEAQHVPYHLLIGRVESLGPVQRRGENTIREVGLYGRVLLEGRFCFADATSQNSTLHPQRVLRPGGQRD